MATLRQALASPDAGWRRIDNIDPNITYVGAGAWVANGTDASLWNSTGMYTNTSGGKARFNFTGTSLRLIGSLYTNRSTSVDVYIDGVLMATFSQYSGATVQRCLDFDISGLVDKEHYVEIINNVSAVYFLDAIDIGSNAYLRPYNTNPKQKICTNITDMAIGDIIPCRYTATSGVAGSFTELGTCVAAEIPFGGAAAPDGLFFFIKTDVGLLIADRVIQISINWDTLNASSYIYGRLFASFGPSIVPITTALDTASVTIAYSTVRNGTYEAWAPYDGVAGTEWMCNNYPSAGALLYNQITFKQGPKTIDGYSFKMRDFGVVTLKGSNDGGTTLDLIDTRSIPANGSYYIPLNSPVTYSTYRFIVSSVYTAFGVDTIGYHRYSGYTKPALIRSINGGVAYLDANGRRSTTDSSLGAWPADNEWDTYVVKSNLGGKITAGDDNVWHWNAGVASLCKDTPSILIAASTIRTLRSKYPGYGTVVNSTLLNNISSSAVSASAGFRPVLEFPEISRCTNVWY